MKRVVPAIAVSLVAGAAVGGLVTSGFVDGGRERPAVQPGDADERLERLEQIVNEERAARIALEDTLAMLFEEIEALENGGATAVTERPVPNERAADVSVIEERRRPRNDLEWMRNYEERRVSRLVEGGYSEKEARRILRLESEASFKALQAAWEAERSGDPIDPFSQAAGPQAILRDSMGDDAYARYLEAQGQPTAVRVTQVMGGSPGSRAGLQPGDELVSYNGERVFSVLDLRELTMQGEPGQDVVIEVDRDGMRMQLTLPSGPIGISGSGAAIRGRGWWGG
jgi:membrane-associated protease RseP (regulator of RpoE activity)